MSQRRLPETDEARNAALTSAKTKKDNVLPAEIVLSPGTVTRLDTQQPVFFQKMLERGIALGNQVGSTEPLNQKKERTRMFISHFFQSFNNGVDRGMFPKDDRGFYQLPISSGAVPDLKSEEKLITWGDRIEAGDPLRVTAGGAAMAMPTAAEVITELNAYKTENNLQSNLKGAYDLAQEAVAGLRPAADSLILRMWNEIETAYSEESAPSKRRKSREWGVVYIPSPGEAPSPDEFSIIGTLTDSITGNGIADAGIKVIETDQTYFSENNGEYYIPVLAPGTYTLQITKTGYTPQNLPGIVVSEGVITEQDVVLSPAAVNGTVSGNVKQTGINVKGANISVMGVPLLTAITDDNGNYSIPNVPPGMQNVQAQLPPANGGMTQMQNVNIVAGSEVNASFVF